MNKITVNDAIVAHRTMMEIDRMGAEFIKEIYKNTPEGYDILSVPEHRSRYDRTYLMDVEGKGIISIEIKDTYNCLDGTIVDVNAEQYFADYIKCAKDYVDTVVALVEEAIVAEGKLEEQKQKDLAEYERIKQKYGL